LIRRAEQLKALGVKTHKTLPDAYMAEPLTGARDRSPDNDE
jgi:hypothetical protein